MIAGTGELGFNGEGLHALDSRLASPTSVLTSPDGHAVIVDYSNMRIRKVEDDGTLSTLAGNGTHAYSEIGADALASPLENPVDAAWGPDGLLYILPQHEGRLIRVGEGGALERVVGIGTLADSGDGGDALDAELGYTAGMAFAEDGTLFISDNTHSRVRRVTPDGTIDTVLGIGTAGNDAPGYGPETAIRAPERVVVDGERLLVADAGNHRVLAVDLATLDVSLFAGSGDNTYAGDGGPAVEASLRGPTGLAVASDGTVFIADFHNNALRAVSPDGTIATVAGGELDGDMRSAPAERFALNRPAGLAFTPEGDLLIAERGASRVLRWEGVDAP